MATLTASPTTFHSIAAGRDDRPHALVIGAGVGGLAAACADHERVWTVVATHGE